MFSRHVLLVFLIFSFCRSFGQKMHAFLFCNTSDKDIGLSASINYMAMRDQFKLLASALNLGYQEYGISGIDFHMSSITNTLAKAQIGSNDVIILYINTHGSKSANDISKFPNLHIPDSVVSVYLKHQDLLKKQPKTILTIIEACSGYLPLSSQQAFVLQHSVTDTRISKLTTRQVENIKHLFSVPVKLIITAGEAGKNTYATSQGSIFTMALLKTMTEHIDYQSHLRSRITWDHVLEQTKTYTRNRTNELPIKYEPVWETREPNGLIEQGFMHDNPFVPRNIEFILKTRKRSIIYRNRYAIELTIKNDSGFAIDSVVYFLHETMPRPIVKNTDAMHNYMHTFTVWGSFPVKAKVYFRDGTNYEIYKDMEFPTKTNSLLK